MATFAFEGTSLMNMFVQNCWVVGTQRIISQRGEEEFIEVRTELSDRSVLYLHRTDRDLGSLLKRLMDAFPEDRATPTQSALLDGLVRIRDAAEANDIEIRLQEVEKLLRRVVTLPMKYSRSEAVLTFFEQSPLDLMIRENNINNMEPYYQSPVTISDIMRCNGFCLANTETIFYDYSAPQVRHRALSMSTCTESAGFGYDTQSGFKETLDIVETASTDGSAEDQETSFPNLTYYQLLTYETDILE
ncbi:PX domain-containing protein 1-like [Oncorhynchus nerka]|uniref:PX domain-containing protein 1-like n=1 Tax=Oncorhynchus nerka TaxID=8023 RepID=UPI00113128F1|nr:PX domain-containing protein 1-like [Oncorhynchus nerka]XP_035643423.1 PX domain-containing protein 1-like [Oncorhynchus keta]